MANKELFKSTRGRTVKAADTRNAAGGVAYKMSNKGALARYAATGCLSNTYYVKAEDHLKRVIEMANECDPEFVAKLAVYARRSGHMKDMPSLLVASLAARKDGLCHLKPAFQLAIDNGRMLRNFVQIMRSGKLGRKSLGTGPKNLVREFLAKDATWLFRQLAVGQTPSGADIIKMVHPKGDQEHDALFSYMIGKKNQEKMVSLPNLVKHFEQWKKHPDSCSVPSVPFELLTAQPLNAEQWARIFSTGGWHFVRMNLNTAVRHGVLEGMKEEIAKKLRDAETIRKSRVMPYQVLAAYTHIDKTSVPRVVVNALHSALETSMGNVPELKGNTFIIVDVSGSMRSAITGWNAKKPSKIRCVDVAALLACALVKKNPNNTRVLPVDTAVHTSVNIEPKDTIMTSTEKLARMGGGGTNLSLGFNYITKYKHKVDNLIIVSDQESWLDSDQSFFSRGTGSMKGWEEIRSRNPKARMVCIDIVPGRTHQIPEGNKEILHVAGWNDSVFRVMASFLNGDTDSWVELVESISLDPN